jgi:CHAT domain-containing protein
LQSQELIALHECNPAVRPENAVTLHLHLGQCATCLGNLQRLIMLDDQLKRLAHAPDAAPQPECPDPRVWLEVAAALTPPEQAQTLLLHAISCDYCGPQLAQAADDVSEAGRIERDQIAALNSAHPNWQRKLAQNIAGSAAPVAPPWWKRGQFAGAFAAATVAVVVISLIGWSALHRDTPDAANELLAKAYAEQRTLELRIPGAPHAPVRVQRGPEGSFSSRPEALLDAESLIARQVESHPSDPQWLQAKARADLLEGKYDPAVDSLRRALQLSPKSPAILIDLGTAYFQRAESADHPEDFGAAYEYLSQALIMTPDDPVALFNRGIIAERQYLYRQALDDFEHYLRVDPNSEWAAEARQRANAIREKLDRKSKELSTPLLTPAEIASRSNDPALAPVVDARVEQYLDVAIRVWLPQAYPGRDAAPDQSARQALFFLADLTARQHNDRWLSDLLHGASAPNFLQAVDLLARAVESNYVGKYDDVASPATTAENFFRQSGNSAGALRAELERTFAEHFNRHGDACRKRATISMKEARNYPYPWLQVQLSLEESVCYALMSDWGTSYRATEFAATRAQESRYPDVFLRALSFLAEDRSDMGDQTGAWKFGLAAFAHCWSVQVRPLRILGIYSELAYVAQAQTLPSLRVALWQQALAYNGPDEPLDVRAMSHVELANAATQVQPQMAQASYAEAARLFALAPDSQAAREDVLWVRLWSAQLNLGMGKTDHALEQLTSLQDQLRRMSDNYYAQIYYSALGQLQLRRHRAVEAEQSLLAAKSLAERNLSSLNSESDGATWSKNAAPLYRALAEAELLQGRSLESFQIYESFLGASLRAAPKSSSNLPTAVCQSSSTSHTLLVYGALPDGLAIWVCDDRGVESKWLPQRVEDLKEATTRLRDVAMDPRSEAQALRRESRALYEAFIAPVESSLLPDKTLVIESEGWLSQIPFEALIDSRGHYLVERYSVVYSLGQDFDSRLRTDSGITPGSPALVVASNASSPAQGLIPLPDVAAEAEAIGDSFTSAHVFKGRDATLEKVVEYLPSARVFHFAGHSLATPQNTGLLFPPRPQSSDPFSLLEAADLRRLDLSRLDLAVLSACSTASSVGGSDGFNSVTEALLRAGVPHVVASRWAVDSEVSRAYATSFYREVLSGKSISESVRTTAIKMLADPRTSHPYFWSAFAAYGRP